MKRIALLSIALLGLTACGGTEQPPAQAQDTVDACYQEQAEAYELAALSAKSSIQSNVPEMVRAVEEMVAAGVPQDAQALRKGYQRFSAASEQMLGDGEDFGAMMERAEGLC